MSNFFPVIKDEEREHRIPSIWRNTLINIVESFKYGDFSLEQTIPGVSPISESEARRISDNISSYGETLESLPEDTWTTSICRWQIGYWEVLVDLFTIESGASDLVLFVRVFDDQEYEYRYEIESVNVP